MTSQDKIEERLAATLPEVEVLACERVAAERLRLTIDHPGGVDHGLCERVTNELRDLLLDNTLEVSSPGPERPLVKPEHFRRFIGSRARVRTRQALGDAQGRSADRSSSGRAPDRKTFTGELVGASDEEVTMAADSGLIAIPYEEIARSNVIAHRGPLPPGGQTARGGEA